MASGKVSGHNAGEAGVAVHAGFTIHPGHWALEKNALNRNAKKSMSLAIAQY